MTNKTDENAEAPKAEATPAKHLTSEDLRDSLANEAEQDYFDRLQTGENLVPVRNVFGFDYEETEQAPISAKEAYLRVVSERVGTAAKIRIPASVREDVAEARLTDAERYAKEQERTRLDQASVEAQKRAKYDKENIGV